MRSLGFGITFLATLSCAYEPTSLEVNFVTGTIRVLRSTPVVADGQDSAEVKVWVKDAKGNALGGYQVQLEGEGVDITQPSSATDSEGKAWGWVSASLAGDKTIGAKVQAEGGEPITLPQQATVRFVWDPKDTVAFADRSDYPVGAQPSAVAIADVSSDGQPDVVTADRGSNTLSLLLGHGSGSLDYATGISLTASPRAMAAADVNDDPYDDVVVALSEANTVEVRLGKKDATLSSAPSLTLAGYAFPAGIVLANLDNVNTWESRAPELLVVNANAATEDAVSVCRTSEGGLFAGVSGLPSGVSSSAAAVGRLDDDEWPDIAVAVSASHSVRLFHGTASGAFEAGEPLATTCAPETIVVSDLDGSGPEDVAVACPETDKLVLFLQASSTSGFGAPVTLAAPGSPKALVAADVNDDGRVDLMTANRSADSLSLFLSRDGGSFAVPPVQLATAKGPVALAVGDLNWDDRIDLVAACYDAGDVSVILGQ